MFIWTVTCQTESCEVFGLIRSGYQLDPNYMPERVCGACDSQYTNTVIVEKDSVE